ncbi:hypothetical protein CXB51_031642 [Gossypium anomalum]|uniref:Uncharacterized protein n=1 Tax=Gossypium anomalum TaxID=47600 RepID=A0A8J5Y4Q3_9ROSI|nr:hypothetical protein CXB51_031642 [Gossypium anomalum]
MLYLITMKALNQVFSPHGFVEKIVTFQKSAGFQALIQYQGRQNAILARISLQVHCNNERRDFINPNFSTEQKGEPSQHLGCGDAGVGFPQMANATAIATAFGRGLLPGKSGINTQINAAARMSEANRKFSSVGAAIQGSRAGENVIGTSLAVPQVPISKSENGYGDGGVEVKKSNNVPIDAEEYRTILKNKIHQACAIVALSYASVVKAAGSFAQAENQVLQSGSDVQGPSKTQEQGEPDAGISAVSTTQKMSGTQVRQAISGINDRCTMMGKVSPNEYPLSGVPVANDPVAVSMGFNILLDLSKTSALDYLGSKLFKSSLIVCACCSSYVPEESVVLLENGALFLFDLASCVNWLKLNGYNDSSGVDNYKLLGIEFSWHPRILVVARSNATLLLDFRQDEYNLIFLAKIEMLNPYAIVDEDQFLAFSRAGADGFQFVLASKSLLLLCDVCKPMVPLLCWVHHLDNPCFIDVIRLSELRSQFRDDTYQWATESGFCIILGLFWNCEFRLFCYGPSSASEGYVATEISKFCKPFLSRDLSKLLCESDEFDGFILIMLILLYSSSDNEYEFPKRFKYLNLDYLRGYLNDMTMPLKFSVVPDLPQLPPFLLGKPSCRNIKWSHKM